MQHPETPENFFSVAPTLKSVLPPRQSVILQEQPDAPLSPFALLIIEFNDFTPLNAPNSRSNSIQLKIRDRLLAQITETLKSQLRETDLLNASTPNQFVIALRSEPLVNAPLVASRLVKLLGQPLLVEGQPYRLACRIGMSFFPDDGTTTPELITQATLAAETVRSPSMGLVHLYQSDLPDAISQRLQIERALQDPDLVHQLTMVYQPQWDLISEQLYGFECLVRWNHPRLGRIDPALFVPIAEEIGCIQTITQLALRRSLGLTRKILSRHDRILRSAINVSAHEFTSIQALDEMVTTLLAHYQLPGDVLTLELTERVFLEQSNTITASMTELQERGIRLSIDDFGTGFSCLNYLLDLPLDTLKIDRKFVQAIDQDPKRQGIVQAIAAMATSLNMQCIAEGVETESELRCLKPLGCSIVQGHLVSPALTEDSFLEFVEVALAKPSLRP